MDLQFKNANFELLFFGEKILKCFDEYFMSDVRIEPLQVKKYCSGIHGNILDNVYRTHMK